jgi:soluble lytic murein transglycosylase-like protein
MATIIDSLIVTLGLDSKGFRKGAADAKQATEDLKKSTVAGATTAEQTTKKTGDLGAKLAKTRKVEAEAERKRRQQASQQARRDAADQKKHTDATIDGLKSIGRMAATAVIGFETLKGAIIEYGNTVGNLANIGRFASTVGVDPKTIGKLGNAYSQVGGKPEDATRDLQTIAHAQFSQRIGAPDAFAAWARRQGIGLFDAKTGKDRDPMAILKDVGDTLRRSGASLKDQAQYMEEMGLSAAAVQLYVVQEAKAREDILRAAERTNAVDAQKVKNAEATSRAWANLKNTARGVWQKDVVGETMPAVTKTLNDLSGGHLLRGFGDYTQGMIDFQLHAVEKLWSHATQSMRRTPSHGDARQTMMFRSAEKKYGLPTGLLENIARVESSFNPNAKSKRGAVGLMQLMPQYFPNAGQDQGKDVDDAGREMSRLLKVYKGNMMLALMAYNDGQGNLDKRLKGGTAAPDETLQYVPRILSGMPNAGAYAGFASSASAAPGPGGRAGAGALTASTGGGGTNVEIDNINIVTQATDANGIAATIPEAIRRKGVIAQANSGMN